MDYYYGHSYDLGVSSMLMWALASAPSKDTFWTTPNSANAIEKKGCDSTGCPADHSAAGCELHTMLALMSTGPVGFSDFANATNRTLLMRTCDSTGTLFKPSKPLTTVDGALHLSLASLDSGGSEQQFVFGSYSGYYFEHGSYFVFGYYFVSFKLSSPYDVQPTDFWPPLNEHFTQFVYRADSGGQPFPCMNGTTAASCGVHAVSSGVAPLLQLPANAKVGTANEYAPTLTTVVPVCASGYALLGELEKFASLSAYPSGRFSAVGCTPSGVQCILHGTPGEEVSITVLVPDADHHPAATVLALQRIIPASGSLEVSL
jgi:hypothetical protein